MLTGKQKQYLKGIATSFPAVVQIGKDGLTDSVIKSASDVLEARELIKVKINQNSVADIRKAAEIFSERLNAEIVQIIGRNCILFKQKREIKNPIIIFLK